MKPRYGRGQVKAAIRQFLQYGEDGLDDGRDLPGNMHKGYYSPGGGAYEVLRWHLEQMEMKDSPVFDEDGYPSEGTLAVIRDWPSGDPFAFFTYCAAAWNEHDFVEVSEDKMQWRFITGGWSGNESVIEAMSANKPYWLTAWQSSEHGGLHVFKLPSYLKK